MWDDGENKKPRTGIRLISGARVSVAEEEEFDEALERSVESERRGVCERFRSAGMRRLLARGERCAAAERARE